MRAADALRRLCASGGRGRLAEGAIVAAIFAVSATAGIGYLERTSANGFGSLLPVTAMVACGQGFMAPERATAGFVAFSRRERAALPCDEAVGVESPVVPGAFAQSHRALIYPVGLAARVTGGLSWAALDRVVGAILGASMVLTYLVFRLGLGRLLSLAGVAVILASDHLAAIADLRDFSKAPVFLAAWLAIGWMLTRRQPTGPAGYLPAAAAGAAIGAGLGFRMDVAVCIPPCLAVIAFAQRGWDRPAAMAKARALAAFGVALLVTAAPTVASIMPAGSNTAHVAVLGQMTPFTSALGLQQPVYDIGSIYSDGFARAVIAAYASRGSVEAPVSEIPSTAYDREGAALLIAVAQSFPADQIVRAMAATRQVLHYPFSTPARHWHLGHPSLSTWLRTAADGKSAIFAVFDGWAVVLVGVAVILVCLRAPRPGVMLALLILYFCSYAMLQFSRRHTFHLDLVPIGALLIAVQATATLVVRLVAGAFGSVGPRSAWALAPPGSLARATVALLLIAAAPAATLGAARQWQQGQARSLIDSHLRLPWQPLAVTQEPLAGLALPPWLPAFVNQPALSMETVLVRMPAAPPAPAGTTAVRSHLLRVEVGGVDCLPGNVPVTLKYTGPVSTLDWEYARAFEVEVDGRAAASVLLVPIFEWPGRSRFDGFLVPADRASCLGSVSAVAAGAHVPLPMLAAALPPDWQSMPLYQRMLE